MLKRYTASDRVQWVGRAWEIRRALQQEMKRAGGKARLTDLLVTDRAPASRGRSPAR